MEGLLLPPSFLYSPQPSKGNKSSHLQVLSYQLELIYLPILLVKLYSTTSAEHHN